MAAPFPRYPTVDEEPVVLQIAMSALVALAGLFLVITADSDFRLFGWFLLVLGVLGVASRFLVRPRRR
jgi:hypothetical protein